MAGRKHALVVGANGMVGTELSKQLLADEYYEKVTLVARRYVDIESEKVEIKIVDFTDLHKDWDVFECDHLFYCLGTTTSKTPVKSKYKEIEFDYCRIIAKISHHNNVEKFLYISTLGANPKAWTRERSVKGHLEKDLMNIGFDYLHIFRPFVLVGNREEFRISGFFTRLFLRIFNFMMIGFLKNIKRVPVSQLAKAMIHNAKLNSKGVFIHSNRNVHDYFPEK